MGYLDNATLIVDAILTRRGRELIAKGDGSFKITQFAVSDDEVDYNIDSDDIEDMSILEAFPDERYIMKHKLITANRGLKKIPILYVDNSSLINLKSGVTSTISPQTLNFPGTSNNIEPSGYAATISDIRLLSTFTGSGGRSVEPDLGYDPTVPSSKTVVGTSFSLRGSMTGFDASGKKEGTITIVGRDSGARITIPIIVTETSLTAQS